MRFMGFLARLFAVLIVSTSAFASDAIWLVLPHEVRPNQNQEPSATRAITRGPAINIKSPSNTTPRNGTPFSLVIEFTPRGGSEIVPQSVKLLLKTNGSSDITSRVANYISPSGIHVPAALAPIGMHTIEVQVADNSGRRTTTVVNLNVQ